MAVRRDEVAKEFEELLVEQFDVPRADIAPDAHLFDDLGLDSIDLMSALAIVESRHGITITDDDLPDMLVVRGCIDRIAERVADATGPRDVAP